MNQINDYLATFLLPNTSFSNGRNSINESNQESSFEKMLFDQMNSALSSDEVSSNALSNVDSNPLSSLLLPSTMGNMPNSFGVNSIEQFTQIPSLDQVNQAYDNNGNMMNKMDVAKSASLTKQPPTDQYNALIDNAAKKHGVDANLIHSIIKMESNYDPNVTSHAGATGLMQLMPETAKTVGVTNRNDIAQNIDGGTNYFSKMLKEQKGDIRMALAAYNAGPGNVKKYGGVPPFKETQNYIRKVMDHYKT